MGFKGFKNDKQRKAMFAKLNPVRHLSLVALKKRGIKLNSSADTDRDRWLNRDDPQPLNNRVPKLRYKEQNIGEFDKEFKMPKDSLNFEKNEHSAMWLDPANVAARVHKDEFLADGHISQTFKDSLMKSQPVTHFRKALIDYGDKTFSNYRNKPEYNYILSTADGKTSKYSAEYLRYLMKEVKGQDAKFKMEASDTPLFIESGNIVYILAPKIENN